MKKILAVMLALAMILCFCACNQTEEPQKPEEPIVGPGTTNPMTEVASLDEINAATGCNMTKPGVMGISDEKFFTINAGDYTIGEYRFTVGGVDYRLRAAATTEDISGVYVGEGTAFPEVKEGIDYVDADGTKLARWFDLNGQHVLSAMGEIDDETFAGIAEELCNDSKMNGGENGGEEEPVIGAGMVNPMTQVASLEEINAAAGCYLVKPGVMGVSDEEFYTINAGDYTIGEYRFKINGVSYTLRAAATTEDISGVYVGEGTAFPEVKDGIDIVETDEVKLARWFNLNGQHILYAKGEIDSETFAGVAEEISVESGLNGGSNG